MTPPDSTISPPKAPGRGLEPLIVGLEPTGLPINLARLGLRNQVAHSRIYVGIKPTPAFCPHCT